MERTIKELIKKALEKSQMESDKLEIQLTAPQLQFGDFSTNIAMILAKILKKNPFEIAETIVNSIEKNEQIEKVQVLRPGFINFWLSKKALIPPVQDAMGNVFSVSPVYFGKEKKVMVEFAHPNTLKLFHIGHLRNISTGESVVRLLKAAGNTVIRANYQGDVGLHIGKTLWKMKQFIAELGIDVIRTYSLRDKIALLGKAYAEAEKAFGEDENAKKEIYEINKMVYEADERIMDVWKETREWSIAYFEEMYKRVYSHFDRCYFESEVHLTGLATSKELLKKGILKESEGAVVFDGTQYGLDTRVFINSLGFPTYEGKELGLAQKEFKDFGTLDKNIHVVTPEQTSFFKITFKVEELMDSDTYGGKQHHLIYEWVKLKEGKMSSRMGNVVEGAWILDETKKKILEKFQDSDAIAETLAVASVKYSFLKNSTNSVIAFDLDESISLEGNSAPYIMYTFARTQSILKKDSAIPHLTPDVTLNESELSIIRLLYQYREKVRKAAETFSPNLIAGYLYDLTREYNLFYQKNPILKAEKEQKDLRIAITQAVGQTIQHGFSLLGIETVDHM
ncbi:MAG: arginine--tRNA ligase [Microgenomates group bacterium]